MSCENVITKKEETVQREQVLFNSINIKTSVFQQGTYNEHHLMLCPEKNEHFDIQLENIHLALSSYISLKQIESNGLVLLRFFISDAANQMEGLNKVSCELESTHGPLAVSIVQQPPLDGNKVVAWAYIVDSKHGIEKKQYNNYLSVKWDKYEHLYHTQLLASDNAQTSYQQTDEIFKSFNDDLEEKGLLMKDHCLRTWIYVKDVDYNYNGVVVSRREYFNRLGMTANTHFISSTGIEGRHFNYNKNVLMDAYSIKGINKDQIQFLQALDYLNPTHEYGVTFERGTAVDLDDRRHIYLSGTASIDNKGEVVHPQQIEKQIERTVTNVKALLADAKADINDLAHLIIYLRDVADTKVVENYFDTHHNNIPRVIVLAPVCRPGWLIEMEGIAIKSLKS